MKLFSLFLLGGPFLITAILSDAAAEDAMSDFSEELITARISGAPLPQLSVEVPEAGIGEAYRMQKKLVQAVTEQTEDGIAGFKGAVVGKSGQEFMEIPGPLSAVLFQSGWMKAAEVTEVPMEQVPNVGIETEMGFILGEDVTEPIESPEAVTDLISRIVPVIELPAGERDTTGKTTPADLVAVNVMSGYYIVGSGKTPMEVSADQVAIRLIKDGTPVHETSGNAAHGGQWWNVMTQINRALSTGYELKEGQLIITGALGEIYRDVPGSFEAEFEGLGTIRFVIE